MQRGLYTWFMSRLESAKRCQDLFFPMMIRFNFFSKYGMMLGVLFILTSVVVEHVYGAHHEQELSSILVSLLSEIGAVILALSTIHLFFEKQLFDKIKFKIIESNKNLSVLSYLNVSRIRKTLPNAYLAKQIENSNYIKILKTFFPESNDLKEGLKKCLRKQGRVELYLLQPESSILALRSQCGDRSSRLLHENYGKEKVIEAVNIMYNCIFEDKKGEGKVVLYDYWPGSPLIMIGKTIFVGSYLIGKFSPSWPWMQVETGSDFYSDLLNQFKIIETEGHCIVLEKKEDYEAFLQKYVHKHASHD